MRVGVQSWFMLWRWRWRTISLFVLPLLLAGYIFSVPVVENLIAARVIRPSPIVAQLIDSFYRPVSIAAEYNPWFDRLIEWEFDVVDAWFGRRVL